jgi:hypothetical protein
MSLQYDPLTCLEDEIKRFMRTNTFTPMEVTGFYLHARCVVSDVKQLRTENAALRAEVERLNRRLTESNQAFAVLDGVRTRAESRAEVAEADVERLDWLDGRRREIETGLWQWSIWHNRPVGVRAAIDGVKGGKP